MFHNCTADQLYRFIRSYSEVDPDISLRRQSEIIREKLSKENYIVTDDLHVIKYFNQDMLRLTAMYSDYDQIIELSQISRLFNSAFSDSFWIQYLNQKYNIHIDALKQDDLHTYMRLLNLDISVAQRYLDNNHMYKTIYQSQTIKMKYLFLQNYHKYDFFISTEKHDDFTLIDTYNHQFYIGLQIYLRYEDIGETLSTVPYNYYIPLIDELFDCNLEVEMIDISYPSCYFEIVENGIENIIWDKIGILHPSAMNLDRYIINHTQRNFGENGVSGDITYYLYKINGEKITI